MRLPRLYGFDPAGSSSGGEHHAPTIRSPAYLHRRRGPLFCFTLSGHGLDTGPRLGRGRPASPSFNVPGGTRNHGCGRCPPLLLRAYPEGSTPLLSRHHGLNALLCRCGLPDRPVQLLTPGPHHGGPLPGDASDAGGPPPRSTVALLLRLNLIVPVALLSPARGGHRFASCTPYRGIVHALKSTHIVWSDYSLRTI